MKINTNTWNKIRYTLYTPGYDSVAKYFKASRTKSIDSLDLKPSDKVLIIGAGFNGNFRLIKMTKKRCLI